MYGRVYQYTVGFLRTQAVATLQMNNLSLELDDSFDVSIDDTNLEINTSGANSSESLVSSRGNEELSSFRENGEIGGGEDSSDRFNRFHSTPSEMDFSREVYYTDTALGGFTSAMESEDVETNLPSSTPASERYRLGGSGGLSSGETDVHFTSAFSSAIESDYVTGMSESMSDASEYGLQPHFGTSLTSISGDTTINLDDDPDQLSDFSLPSLTLSSNMSDFVNSNSAISEPSQRPFSTKPQRRAKTKHPEIKRKKRGLSSARKLPKPVADSRFSVTLNSVLEDAVFRELESLRTSDLKDFLFSKELSINRNSVEDDSALLNSLGAILGSTPTKTSNKTPIKSTKKITPILQSQERTVSNRSIDEMLAGLRAKSDKMNTFTSTSPDISFEELQASFQALNVSIRRMETPNKNVDVDILIGSMGLDPIQQKLTEKHQEDEEEEEEEEKCERDCKEEQTVIREEDIEVEVADSSTTRLNASTSIRSNRDNDR